MSLLLVDDGDPNLFTIGEWEQENFGTMADRGTVSWSHSAGDTKVARFIGTSITVRGGLQPIINTDHSRLVLQFIIDGGTPFTYSPQLPDSGFDYVDYFQSQQLPLGEHVLTMVNTVSNDICLLDSFTIQANGGTAQILKSNGSATPSQGPAPHPNTTPPTSNNPKPSPTSPPITVVATTVVVSLSAPNNSPTNISVSGSSDNTPSSRPESASSSNTSSSPSQTNSSNDTSYPSSSAPPYNPTPINANGTTTINQTEKGTNQTLVIVTSVASGLLFLLIAGIALFLLRRRRRRQNGPQTPKPSLAPEPYPPQSIHIPASPSMAGSPPMLTLSSEKRTAAAAALLQELHGQAGSNGSQRSASPSVSEPVGSSSSSLKYVSDSTPTTDEKEHRLLESVLPPYAE